MRLNIHDDGSNFSLRKEDFMFDDFKKLSNRTKQCINRIDEKDITIKTVNDCHIFTAKLVDTGGNKFLPLFERVTQIKNDFEKDQELLSLALKVANDN